MRLVALVVVGLVAVASCGNGDNPAPPIDACGPATLFLNRNGGIYDPAPFDDATINGTVLLDEPITLAPWPHDERTWQSTARCIRDSLAPFPIGITEVDPGTAAHFEIVFTTSYWAGSPGTTSVIPDACRSGHELEFVFGDALPSDIAACHTALASFAKMTALLSTASNCRDVLDRSQDCVPMREFLDETLPCVDGANQPTTCRCGGTTQNSFRAMQQAFPGCAP